jgi:hypothetical protein
MSNQKVNEVYVSYELKDDAKKLGCRWDSVKTRWYILSEKFVQDMDLYNDFRALALADTNLVSNDDLKLLGCKFNMEYKKWTVSKSIYEKRKLEFDLHKLVVLTEIKRAYLYVPPPVKSEEEQLAELILFMRDDYNED